MCGFGGMFRLQISVMRNLLFSLLSPSAMDPSVFESVCEDDWRALYALSCGHGVAALVCDGIRRSVDDGVLPVERQPSKILRIRWALTAESVEAEYARQKSVICKLAKFFAEHDIRMTVLKGYGLSLDYPCANHRPCCDVDIRLFEERPIPSGHTIRTSAHRRGDALLREHLNIDIDESKHHHTVFRIDGVHVENHYDFVNVHAHRSDRIVERRLKEMEQHGLCEVDVDGTAVYLPSPDLHALFLLRHSAAHFAADRIVLRHLLDWNFFMSKHGADIDWPRLTEFSEQMNMHRFLYCLNSICVDYLGLPSDRVRLSRSHAGCQKRVLDDILCPEFSEVKPRGAGYVESWSYMLRRWLANRWKRGIVYREGTAETFFTQVCSHLMKPESLKI